MAQIRNLSSTQRMADAILAGTGTTLKDFLEIHRARGLSYESIAKELFSATSGSVDIGYQTIKRWLIDFDLLEVAS